MRKLIANGVYIIGVPIGNYKDITIRALDVLKEVDLIICEDSRETKLLLDDFLIKKELISYIGSRNLAINKSLSILKNNGAIGIVSDRGMPCISDPGADLITFFRSLKFDIHMIPGVSAVTTAFALSGLSGNFYFAGFLSKKKNAVISEITELIKSEAHIVCFESSHRIKKTLELFKAIIPNKIIYILRELTKTYEEVLIGNAEELLEKNIQGEIVIIITQ